MKTVPTTLLDQTPLREFVICLGNKHLMIPPYHDAVDLIKRETNRVATPWQDRGLQVSPPFFVKFTGTHDDLINVKWAMKKGGFTILGYHIYVKLSGIVKVGGTVNLNSFLKEIEKTYRSVCVNIP